MAPQQLTIWKLSLFQPTDPRSIFCSVCVKSHYAYLVTCCISRPAVCPQAGLKAKAKLGTRDIAELGFCNNGGTSCRVPCSEAEVVDPGWVIRKVGTWNLTPKYIQLQRCSCKLRQNRRLLGIVHQGGFGGPGVISKTL